MDIVERIIFLGFTKYLEVLKDIKVVKILLGGWQLRRKNSCTNFIILQAKVRPSYPTEAIDL